MKRNTTLINSVPELIDSLNNCEKSNYQDLIRNLELDIEDVKKYCTWNEDNYTRNLIHFNDNYQLLILCWQQEQYSSIHNHGGRDCFMYVIEGSIQENIYQLKQNNLINCQKNIYTQGDNSYMLDSMGMHSIKCVSNRAVTLHLYAKPIEEYHIFDLKKNKLVCLQYVVN